jgi:hypothetical protein
VTDIAGAVLKVSGTLSHAVRSRQHKTRRSGYFVPVLDDYAPWMFEACLPFGAVVTSKVTFTLWLARQYDDYKRKTFNTRASYAKNMREAQDLPAGAGLRICRSPEQAG